jgi:hypothetical protein
MKHLVTTLAALVVPLAALAGAVRPAQAQWGGQWTNPYTGNRWNNPVSSYLDTQIMHSMQRRAMYRGMLQKKGYSDSKIDQIMKGSEAEIMAAVGLKKGSAPEPSSPATGAKAGSAVPATRFRPTGRRLVMDSFVTSLTKKKDEQGALRQLFGEIFKAYETEAKKAGIANDIAGALTFFVAANYSAYNNGTAVSDPGTEAMTLQFRTALDSEGMRKAPDAEKQKMYELFVLMGGLTLATHQAAVEGKDADLEKTARKMGGDGLQYLLKVDPSRVKITDTGLEIAPESRSPSAPGAEAAPEPSCASAPVAVEPIGRGEEFSYSLPSGWTEGKENGLTVLTGTTNAGTALRVVLLGTVPNPGDLQAATAEFWKQMTVSSFTPLDPPGESPPIYRRYVGSGVRAFFTYYPYMRAKNGSSFNIGGEQVPAIPVSLYVIESGKNIYPLIVLYLCSSSHENQRLHDTLLEPLFKSIKGSVGTARKPLVTAAELAGTWKQTLVSVSGSLVTRSGVDAGAAGGGTMRTYVLLPDGRFSGDATGFHRGTLGTTNTAKDDTGTWRLDGHVLVMKDSRGQTVRRPFLGINRDKKNGSRLLTLGEENPSGALPMNSLSMERIRRYYHDLTEEKK